MPGLFESVKGLLGGDGGGGPDERAGRSPASPDYDNDSGEDFVRDYGDNDFDIDFGSGSEIDSLPGSLSEETACYAYGQAHSTNVPADALLAAAQSAGPQGDDETDEKYLERQRSAINEEVGRLNGTGEGSFKKALGSNRSGSSPEGTSPVTPEYAYSQKATPGAGPRTMKLSYNDDSDDLQQTVMAPRRSGGGRRGGGGFSSAGGPTKFSVRL